MSATAALPISVGPFSDSLEHLTAELARIDDLLRAELGRARKYLKDHDYQGLYVSEDEIDESMARPASVPRWAAARAGDADALTRDLQHREAIASRVASSKEAGICLRLPQLQELFSLSNFDTNVILLCMASELDLRYERVFGYLQDDITRKRPSVDLVLNVLCSDLRSKVQARNRFAPSAPLCRHAVVELAEETSGGKASLLNRFVRLDDRITDFLLGSDEPDVRLTGGVRELNAAQDLEELFLPSQLRLSLERFARKIQADDTLVIALHGVEGSGRRAVAEAVCRKAGRTLLQANVDGRTSSAELQVFARRVAREARLRSAAVYWEGFADILDDEHRRAHESIADEMFSHPICSFVPVTSEWEPGETGFNKPFLRFELGAPTFAARHDLWQAATNGLLIDVTPLAGQFRMTPGQIRHAVRTGFSLAARRADDAQPGTPDFQESCRLHSNRKLASLARKITPRYHWQDIVLAEDRLQQLQDICAAVKFRPTVFENWGFDGKLSLGKGINVLFAGPSGTGKTMAAEILANELGQDLYKIDLSTIVSKYIGETEKNLAKIFAEAASSNSILFFDEADALFGKRTEVRDSHDRYANVEVNYLLQEMEHYDGIAILATNMRKNMDDAFVRRMQFAIEFPFPRAADRFRIWQGIWPRQTPVADDLDLEFLAEAFDLTGGSIRNVVVTAAFLAAADTSPVRMQHIIRAIRREYQKMGKVMTEDQFGHYALADCEESDSAFL